MMMKPKNVFFEIVLPVFIIALVCVATLVLFTNTEQQEGTTMEQIIEKMASGQSLTPHELQQFKDWYASTQRVQSLVDSWTRPMETKIRGDALAEDFGTHVTVLQRFEPLLITNNNDTIIDWDTVYKQGMYEYDTTNQWFKIPKKDAGVLMTGKVVTSSAATGWRTVTINVYDSANNLLDDRVTLWTYPQDTGAYVYSWVTTYWWDVADFKYGNAEPDYFKITYFQNSGASVNLLESDLSIISLNSSQR